MSKEAMKLALEALQDAILDYSMGKGAVMRHTKAIKALEEALAKQEQGEPVATIKDNSPEWAGMDGARAYQLIERHALNWSHIARMMDEWLAANTTPQQRKPLTDEQIYDMYNEPRSDAEMLDFARAIEAAHGIK